jgi:hypothetical protein
MIVLSMGLTFFQAMPAQGQQKKTDCRKPPEIIPPPKLSKEEKQRQPKTKVQGAVAIEISEDGNVVVAKALHPTSDEAANQLVSLAKSMKFKPRPGCGVFKTEVNYAVGPQ